MIKITIVTSKNLYQNSVGFLYPLIKWKNNIKSKKIKFSINYTLKNTPVSDVIILDSKLHRGYWLNNPNKIYKDLSFLKNKCNKLVYCDTGDSSGWIQPKIFKHIDKYWKPQILKNKNLYLEKFYDGRIYTDYYYKMYNKFKSKKTNIETEDWLDPISKDDVNKIEVSWNTSFADYSIKYHFFGLFFRKYLGRIFIKNSFSNKFSANNIRKNNLMLNFNTNYSRFYIAYQRKEIKKLFNLEENNYLSKLSYLKKLRNSKMCISPFGWGEIAYRDYETFLNGSILLKPNMDHLETWPELYIRNKTYLDFDWSLQNLKEVYEKVLINYEKYLDIAFTGQSNYLSYLNGENAENKFVLRFIKLLKNL